MTSPRGEISFSHSPSVKLTHRDSTPMFREYIHASAASIASYSSGGVKPPSLYKTGMCGRGRGVGIWQPLRSIEMKSPVTKSWMRSILNLSPAPPPAPKRCVLFMVCYLGSSPAAPPLRSALLHRACGVASRQGVVWRPGGLRPPGDGVRAVRSTGGGIGASVHHLGLLLGPLRLSATPCTAHSSSGEIIRLRGGGRRRGRSDRAGARAVHGTDG